MAEQVKMISSLPFYPLAAIAALCIGIAVAMSVWRYPAVFLGPFLYEGASLSDASSEGIPRVLFTRRVRRDAPFAHRVVEITGLSRFGNIQECHSERTINVRRTDPEANGPFRLIDFLAGAGGYPPSCWRRFHKYPQVLVSMFVCERLAYGECIGAVNVDPVVINLPTRWRERMRDACLVDPDCQVEWSPHPTPLTAR